MKAKNVRFRLRLELSSLQSNNKEANRQLESNKKTNKRLQKDLDGATKEQQELLNEVSRPCFVGRSFFQVFSSLNKQTVTVAS